MAVNPVHQLINSTLHYPSVSQTMDVLPNTQPHTHIISLERDLFAAQRDLHSRDKHIAELKSELNTVYQESHKLRKEIEKLEMCHKKHKAEQTEKQEEQQEKGSVRYFRDWHDVLSPHHPCSIKEKENDTVYRSEEHMYMHKKLKAHGLHSEANKVLQFRKAGKVKSYTRSLIPKPNQKWEQDKAKVMEEVRLLCARSDPTFRKALLDTGDARLIHNMESDPVWGFGLDGKGDNIQGCISENVRSIIRSETSGQEIKDIDNDKYDVEIFTDSILSDMQAYLLELDIQSKMHCFSGQGATDIANKIEETLTKTTASMSSKTIVIHMGTNSVDKEDFVVVQRAFNRAIESIKWHSRDCRIILSGIIHRLDRQDLNFKIDVVNEFLQSLENETTTFMDNNSSFRDLHRILDRRGLHLRPAGYGQVARNIQACLLGSSASRAPIHKAWENQSKDKRTHRSAVHPTRGKPDKGNQSRTNRVPTTVPTTTSTNEAKNAKPQSQVGRPLPTTNIPNKQQQESHQNYLSEQLESIQTLLRQMTSPQPAEPNTQLARPQPAQPYIPQTVTGECIQSGVQPAQPYIPQTVTGECLQSGVQSMPATIMQPAAINDHQSHISPQQTCPYIAQPSHNMAPSHQICLNNVPNNNSIDWRGENMAHPHWVLHHPVQWQTRPWGMM